MRWKENIKMKFKPAPFEYLFLFPQLKCKSCDYPISIKDGGLCINCGKAFRLSFWERFCSKLIFHYIEKEEEQIQKEEKEREKKNSRNCKTHGIQPTLTLCKDNKDIVVCMKCLAEAMVGKPIVEKKDYV